MPIREKSKADQEEDELNTYREKQGCGWWALVYVVFIGAVFWLVYKAGFLLYDMMKKGQ